MLLFIYIFIYLCIYLLFFLFNHIMFYHGGEWDIGLVCFTGFLFLLSFVCVLLCLFVGRFLYYWFVFVCCFLWGMGAFFVGVFY